MLQLRLSEIIQVLKTISFYVLAGLVLAYGNAFRNEISAIIWMFGISLVLGLLHKNISSEGFKYFLTPA